jgi:hypothetical protein
MDNKTDSVDSRLDRPTEPAFADNCITAWDGIGYVNDSVAIMKQSVALLKQDYENIVHKLKSEMLTFSTKVDGMVSEIDRGFADSSTFIKVINDEQIALNQTLQARSLSSLTTPPGSLETEVQDLKNKVDLLQAAMPVNYGFDSGNTILSEEVSSLEYN